MHARLSAALLLAAAATSTYAAGPGTFTDPTPGAKTDADITYYLPGEPGPLQGKGACGIQNHITDRIVAVSKGYWDKVADETGTAANGNDNPLCNRKIEITTKVGKETATITDRCGDCPRDDSVDVTPALAKTLIGADYEKVGRVTDGVSWKFIDDPSKPVSGSDTAAPAASAAPATSAPAAAAPPKREASVMGKRRLGEVY